MSVEQNKAICGRVHDDIFRVKDGRIADFYQRYDQTGMMKQLGVMPAAATAVA